MNRYLHLSAAEASARIAEDYLAGKPRGIPRADRDAAFWSSGFLSELPADALRQEPLVLALAEYLAQDSVAAPGILERFAATAPEAMRRAVRLSGLVRRPESPRLAEFFRVARAYSEEFGDFVAALEFFLSLRRTVEGKAAESRQRLPRLSLPDYLAFVGLEACRRLATDDFETRDLCAVVDGLIAWKLETAGTRSLSPTPMEIEHSVLIDPSQLGEARHAGSARARLLEVFRDLVESEIGLHDSAAWTDAYSYNEPEISVARDGGDEMLRVNVGLSDGEAEAWRRSVDRAAALHVYWLARALAEFAARGPGRLRAASRRRNWFAILKAKAACLRLMEVFGIAETTRDGSGRAVPLFKALLALEIVMELFEEQLVSPYRRRLESASWLEALPRKPVGRQVAGFSGQLPVAWADRSAVVRRVARWVADPGRGLCDLREAEAIVDFWSLDCLELRERLRRGDPGPFPTLFERPFLSVGGRLAALPWMAGVHYDAAEAALGNLRRLGWRRTEMHCETRRIERTLADLFRARGFRVAVNWTPPVATGEPVPGEVDLVCARDGGVLVLEVKSTWLRRSVGDAWRHMRSARHAGLQLLRKTGAVTTAIGMDASFAAELGIHTTAAPVRGWIVDTSHHGGHERFHGFLKVALEEIVVALRDDSRLLGDVDKAFLLEHMRQVLKPSGRHATAVRPGLYPSGFSLSAFVDVVETGRVWEGAAGQHESVGVPTSRAL